MERPDTPNRPWSEHPRIASIRRRWRTVDVTLQTFEGYSRHRSGRNAALISHFGFLSIFPLVLALTTVLGFVLEGRPDLRARIIDSALAQLPIVGQTIGSNPSELTGSVPVLVFGLAAALWSGLRAFLAVQVALDDVREVARDDRANFATMRLRALAGVGMIGSAQIASATVTSIAGAGEFAILNRVLLVIGALAINSATLVFAYRRLCSVQAPWRQLFPGAIGAGVVFSAMQFFGTTVVTRLIANASPVYGTFASMIALFTWLGLHASVTLLGAEANEVLVRRRLPESEPAPAPPGEPSPIRLV